MRNAKILSFLTLMLLFLSLGCRKDDQSGTVVLQFDHNVKGEALVLDQLRYSCEAGHLFSVIRLKYYVSNFALHKKDGTAFRANVVHYREVGADETRELILAEVPPGEYTALSFLFGLDEATNVDGGLERTTTNINMEWPIPGDQGYHYMKLEGKYDMYGSGVIKNYNLHTGAHAGNQNYVEISLPLDALSINDNTWAIQLEMDINEWLQNPQVYDFETFGPMIMANQDAQEILKKNGSTAFGVASMLKQ